MDWNFDIFNLKAEDTGKSFVDEVTGSIWGSQEALNYHQHEYAARPYPTICPSCGGSGYNKHGLICPTCGGCGNVSGV